MNSSGIIKQANEKFAGLLDLRQEKLRRKAFAELLTTNDAHQFRSRYKVFTKRLIGRTMEVQFAISGDRRLWTQLEIVNHSPGLEADQKSEDEILIAVTDISAQKQT